MKYYNKNNYQQYTFQSILKKYKYNIHLGDIIAGIIKYQEKYGFLVEIGDYMSSYLPIEEITLYFPNYHNLKKNILYITRDFFLIKYEKNNYKSIISIKRLEYILGWKRIKQLYVEDIIFNQKIHHINKGGIVTYLEGLKSFIPNSQQYILNNQKIKLNKYLLCKLLIINEYKNEIIFSNKSALIELSPHKFRIGELTYGVITNIKNYGLFIDIYGILGLLHISEISHSYIYNIHKTFQVGQLIKIKIIHINKRQGRLSVSTKYINKSIANLHQQ
uniref:Ribosomal protein S1 n=1 Tax=Pleonosporium borreri TaxID=2575635 RepID=A0A4D6WVA1_9FLOR|nr:ribosomal protein S1 [Pleonosporium borreri]